MSGSSHTLWKRRGWGINGYGYEQCNGGKCDVVMQHDVSFSTLINLIWNITYCLVGNACVHHHLKHYRIMLDKCIYSLHIISLEFRKKWNKNCKNSRWGTALKDEVYSDKAFHFVPTRSLQRRPIKVLFLFRTGENSRSQEGPCVLVKVEWRMICGITQ